VIVLKPTAENGEISFFNAVYNSKFSIICIGNYLKNLMDFIIILQLKVRCEIYFSNSLIWGQKTASDKQIKAFAKNMLHLIESGFFEGDLSLHRTAPTDWTQSDTSRRVVPPRIEKDLTVRQL
jgi:hypothetical protein